MNDLCSFDPTEFTTAHQTEGWIVFRESPQKVFARVADHASLGDWSNLLFTRYFNLTKRLPRRPEQKLWLARTYMQ